MLVSTKKLIEVLSNLRKPTRPGERMHLIFLEEPKIQDSFYPPPRSKDDFITIESNIRLEWEINIT